ncbi:tetratricopeptide repeat protein [Sulfurimonas sp.]
MKTLILLILLLPIYLLSSQEDNSTNLEATYSKGLEYYNSKDYKSSYDIFKKIYLHKLSDEKFNFYFGKSAYETGNYEVALGAFERVEIQNNSNLANKLEMARTYFMLKMYEDSENAYLYVLENPNIPDNVRRNIELALSKVSKVQQRSFTYATIMADMLYDSNLNYGSLEDYYYSGSLFPKTTEESDTAFQIFSNIVNIYDIGYKNGFAIKNSATMYLKDYSNSKNNIYNVLYLAYNPSLIYKETLFTAEMVLGLDMMELGNKKYLTSMSLMPRFEYNHDNTLKSLIHLKYQRKKFTKDAQRDLDSNRVELSYGLQNILTPRSYMQGKIVASNENKVRGSNIYVDFNEVKLDASYANQFTSKYSVDLYTQVRARKYIDTSSGFGSVRKDTGTTGSIGFTMILQPKLRLKIGTTYEYIKSNQSRFSYKKNTTSAGFIKTF